MDDDAMEIVLPQLGQDNVDDEQLAAAVQGYAKAKTETKALAEQVKRRRLERSKASQTAFPPATQEPQSQAVPAGTPG
eukprot:9112014-Alexandrium_andersonii.AAC.1